MKRVSSFCTSALSKHPMFSQFSQLSQSQQLDDRKPYIYFIVSPGQTVEQCSALNLGEMYQTAEAHALNVMWLEDEECIGQELHADGNIFVFDPFGSPGFQHWMKRLSSGKGGSPRVEILGPMVLRKVFNDPQDISFQTRENPLGTLAMKDMIISLSGIKNKETKDELETLVRWMNGTLSSTLTKAVSHVVTVSALTPKCIEANKEGIPVMLGEWIRQLWKDNQSSFVAPSDLRYVKFKCPIFHNVSICMSQLTAIKKSTLKAAVENHGGRVSSEFVKKQTDVLVIQNPTGDKFKFAQKWNVPCVTPHWIEMSLEKGYLLSTNDFKLTSTVANTPVSPGMPRPMMISTPAHSMMMPAEWNMTRCSAIMGVDDTHRAVVEESKINFTRTFTEMHEEAVSKLKTSAENLYLDGCKIYVVEYPKCDELKRALNKSGAVRVDKLCEGVTHVIVNPDGPNLPKSVQDKILALETTRPHVVTIDWVLQSAKDGNPADEELYKYQPAATTLCQETFNAPAASNLNLSSRIARVSATAMEIQQRHSHSRLSDGNTSSNSTTNTRRSSETPKDGSQTTGTTESNNSATKSNTTDDSDVTQEGNSSTSSGPNDTNLSASGGLLVGLTFKVVNSDKAERKYIEETVVENGGTLVQDNPTVVILEPICDSIEKDRAEKAYTKHWLIECLEVDSLDIEHSFFHTPLCSFPKMEEIMTGVVVAISQFGAVEREYLVEVVKALGGRYQDVFARKDSADGKNAKSTHLICKTMDTDKAKAARKWNVPIVLAEWVTESCIERKRLEEDRFDPAQVSSADDRTVFMPTPQRRRTMNANNNMNNMSVRSVYPPSTQKGKPKPNEMFKDINAGITEQAEAMEREKTPPPTAQPSTSKSTKPDSSNDKFRTPTSAPAKTPVAASKPSNKRSEGVGAKNGEEDSFLAGLPSPGLSYEEMQREMAKCKADFPYSDESYQRHLDEFAAMGIDLNAEASFTAEENERLLNPCPDSPLVMGLPRHESRALKEQFEIALNRETYIPNRIKLKPPASTPLSQIVKRFNSIRHDGSSPSSSPRASTPTSNLRKVAAINQRRSQGNLTLPRNLDQDEEDESGLGSPIGVAGIRKLGNKRPSDGSPEEEESKSSKRARSVSEDNSDVGEIIPMESEPGLSSQVPETSSPEKPEMPKKPNRMQALSDLIAESKPSESNDNEQVSPIKRRSADNVLVPGDEVPEEEIERPHLSWVENDEESVADKKSTVKKANKIKPRIVPANQEAEASPAAKEPEEKQERDTKKRSSRLKKTSSIIGTEEGSGRVTRNTRARSASKTRDEPPIGHQPIKVGEPKKSRKKKAKLPIALPDAPIFVLSSLDQIQRKSAIEAIVRLGGSISKLQHFDMNCHAVVTSALLRSEKILGCIASGKYILKPEYLQKSGEAGNFLPIDEEFLWHEGNINQDKERELAHASFGWLKLQMAEPNRKPMTDMKFFLLESGGEKAKAFERLILAAGGEVVTKLVDATIVLKDEKNLKEVPEGIEAVNPMYLNTLILTLPEV